VTALSGMLVLLAVTLLPPGIATADPVAARGSALANACAACHGPNGRSQGAIPAIDTLSTADFAAALKAFRADTRQGTVMNRIAKGLDDADIEAVASYFATIRQR
jgi:cytochrome subunit of sulfide dehydrogenase